jgi:prepilin-type N-terminal cleavage/methylation domain-containing protein
MAAGLPSEHGADTLQPCIGLGLSDLEGGCAVRKIPPLVNTKALISISNLPGPHLLPHSASSGFTLVELMVTVALLAFFGLVASTTFLDTQGWLAGYRLKAAIRHLEMNFQYARMEAVKRNTYCSITFNQPVDGTTYDCVIYQDIDNDLVFDAGNDVVLKQISFADYQGVSLDALQGTGGTNFTPPNDEGLGSVAFDPKGLPRNPTHGFGAGSIFLISDYGQKLKIVLNSTGRMKIEPYT